MRDQSGMRQKLSTLQQLINVMDPQLYRKLGKSGLYPYAATIDADLRHVMILQNGRIAPRCSSASDGSCEYLFFTRVCQKNHVLMC